MEYFWMGSGKKSCAVASLAAARHDRKLAGMAEHASLYRRKDDDDPEILVRDKMSGKEEWVHDRAVDSWCSIV